jgi:hypothetical protein
MLQGEQAPPKAILTLDGNVVNRLFEFLKTDTDRELGNRFLYSSCFSLPPGSRW